MCANSMTCKDVGVTKRVGLGSRSLASIQVLRRAYQLIKYLKRPGHSLCAGQKLSRTLGFLLLCHLVLHGKFHFIKSELLSGLGSHPRASSASLGTCPAGILGLPDSRPPPGTGSHPRENERHGANLRPRNLYNLMIGVVFYHEGGYRETHTFSF